MTILSMNMRQSFFDRKKVARAVERERKRALSKSGAFLRRRARSSLRRRKKVSQPGKPPSVHSKDRIASLKAIFFAYDQVTKSVIVGPIKLNQVNMTAVGSRPIPAIHEFGGTVRIMEVNFGGRSKEWFRRDLRKKKRPWYRYRTRAARYPRRPFMGPALQAEVKAGNIASPWANVVSE